MIQRKLFMIALCFLLLVAFCFNMVACDGNKLLQQAEEIQSANIVQTMSLKTEFVNTENVKLMAASPAVMATSTGVITQKITATVLPATATNKQVDWTVAWADSGNKSNVSDYVTVTPDSDGSTSATVTCKAAFTGNIVITATTRQNGYTADCIVSYVGIPANIEIITNLTEASDGYHVAVGNSYTFGTELSNPFGEVGNAYQKLEVSVVGVGTIQLSTKDVSSSSGNTTWYDSANKNVDLNTLANNFVQASISTDGTVTVNVVKSIESYYGSMTRIDSGRTRHYEECFRNYVTNCYFKIILTEPKSGISTSFNLVLDENAVAGVSLGSTEMFF
jgi:hypothetical protein